MNYKTMYNPAKLLARTCMFACILFIGISCKDTDEFFSKDKEKSTEEGGVNTFDFSTSQEVDLIVDYSDFQANIPVFFSVYRENPIKNENQLSEYIDENIKPIFAGYTGKDGKFDETITLPAYANVLHVVTGNFLVGLRRKVAVVENGEARVIVENPLKKSNSRRNVRSNAPGAGSPTTDISKMKNLYQSFGGTPYYKEWLTWLGTWNSASGRPDYLLDKTDQTLIDKGLIFSDEEFTGLYATACEALNSGTNMKETYRQASDMTLAKDSEVSITALGSSTCWNSSLGYYYYTGDAPTNKMDLNIIMLFPNTQDGEWPRGNYPKNDYRGNIGTLRGDVVQLMYYPPKADGSLDRENGTTIFPAGTKIGFILKCNSWGSRGANYAVNGSYSNKKNIWASTTDGLSTALDGGTCPNPDGEARSAKFAYTAPNGNQYVVVSFEDACDDKDYDDLMFALNPANAFDFGDEAVVESRKATEYSIWAFEDLWPAAGDYDMNDAIIEVKHDMEYYSHGGGEGMLSTESFYLTTYQNYVTREDGLGFKLILSSGLSLNNDVSTIYVKKIPKGETTPIQANYTAENRKYYYLPEFKKLSNTVYLLTDDIKLELGATYVFEVSYLVAQSSSRVSVKPFIYRPENGARWEVHVPYDQPVDKTYNETFYGKYDDRSTSKNPYLREGLYPFAFNLTGADISVFKETILKRENESKPIDTFFPQFIEWSKSKGKTNPDWYLHPATNIDDNPTE